jgi:hypothetical protein
VREERAEDAGLAVVANVPQRIKAQYLPYLRG